MINNASLLPQLLRSSLGIGLGLACLVFAVILLLMKQGTLESLELIAYDTLTRWRPTHEQPDLRVVLITVTEEDLQQVNGYPVTDAVLAKTLKRLIDYRPRVIGLDIYRDVPVPPGHDELSTVLSSNDNIIGTMKMPEATRPGVAEPPALRQTGRVGFNDLVVDPGGIVRRGLLFMDSDDSTEFSFALRLALRYLRTEGLTPIPDLLNPDHFRLGTITIPPFEANDGCYVNADAGGYQFLLDYRDKPEQILSYTLSQLLSGEIEPSTIKDKIVLVGVTAVSVNDNFHTPLNRDRDALPTTRGLELHTLITHQLLRHALHGQAPMRFLSNAQEGLWVMVWCVLGALVGIRAYLLVHSVAIFFLGLIVLFSTVSLSFSHTIWIPLVAPAFAWVFSITLAAAYSASEQKRQRAQLMNLFSRHVAPEIAEDIWQHRDQFMSAGWPKPQRLTATVMFTDICGFTTISERLSPSELVDWLNEYMEAMTPLIASHRGVVSRFIGDAIMAVFGAPLPSITPAAIQRDAQNAVKAAIVMQEILKQRNVDWQQRGLPAVGMRIGIHTGDMVAGSIGAQQRMEYTLHGDTVNIAARLETFDKDSFIPDLLHDPCRILIGEATFRYLDDRFDVEALQRVSLRGKAQAVTIYRVLGLV